MRAHLEHIFGSYVLSDWLSLVQEGAKKNPTLREELYHLKIPLLVLSYVSSVCYARSILIQVRLFRDNLQDIPYPVISCCGMKMLLMVV